MRRPEAVDLRSALVCGQPIAGLSARCGLRGRGGGLTDLPAECLGGVCNPPTYAAAAARSSAVVRLAESAGGVVSRGREGRDAGAPPTWARPYGAAPSINEAGPASHALVVGRLDSVNSGGGGA